MRLIEIDGITINAERITCITVPNYGEHPELRAVIWFGEGEDNCVSVNKTVADVTKILTAVENGPPLWQGVGEEPQVKPWRECYWRETKNAWIASERDDPAHTHVEILVPGPYGLSGQRFKKDDTLLLYNIRRFMHHCYAAGARDQSEKIKSLFRQLIGV